MRPRQDEALRANHADSTGAFSNRRYLEGSEERNKTGLAEDDNNRQGIRHTKHRIVQEKGKLHQQGQEAG